MMNRTQIYLPRTQINKLKKLAGQRHTTMSEVIRILIGEQFGEGKKPLKKHESLLEAAKRINVKGPAGPRDLSKNLDEYLYGGK